MGFSSQYSYVFIDLNCFLTWAMWPMGLLLKLLYIQVLIEGFLYRVWRSTDWMPTRNYGLKWRLMPRFKWRSVPFTGVNSYLSTGDNIQLPSIDYWWGWLNTYSTWLPGWHTRISADGIRGWHDWQGLSCQQGAHILVQFPEKTCETDICYVTFLNKNKVK